MQGGVTERRSHAGLTGRVIQVVHSAGKTSNLIGISVWTPVKSTILLIINVLNEFTVIDCKVHSRHQLLELNLLSSLIRQQLEEYVYCITGDVQPACSVHYEPLLRWTQGQGCHLTCSLQQVNSLKKLSHYCVLLLLSPKKCFFSNAL